MLPPLDVVVCPDREHKDEAAVRGPGGTVNPLSLERLNCRSVGPSSLSWLSEPCFQVLRSLDRGRRPGFRQVTPC